jgi:hypothetical protein
MPLNACISGHSPFQTAAIWPWVNFHRLVRLGYYEPDLGGEVEQKVKGRKYMIMRSGHGRLAATGGGFKCESMLVSLRIGYAREANRHRS